MNNDSIVNGTKIIKSGLANPMEILTNRLIGLLVILVLLVFVALGLMMIMGAAGYTGEQKSALLKMKNSGIVSVEENKTKEKTNMGSSP
ncbi:hypothetical protein CRE_31262 [Caenorhabditis remanei]|uniref:Uncharacterized protein n=1 Tax=Caenorhabditis remanei TaxID=31234 RepID=E3MLH8_CAERE|nr:hypothetical protein CRE_31262 [Caenorhabditis remanei]